VGMRERAARIGGLFTIESSPDSGTSITLVVPGRVAFRSTKPTLSQRFRSLISGD
jgi:signal transduction histidine kinase